MTAIRPVSINPCRTISTALGKGLKGLRIGLPKEYFIGGMDPEVDKAVREAVKTLESFGATTREISLPHTDHGLARLLRSGSFGSKLEPFAV